MRVAMIANLARASGSLGMAGGQALDLESEGKTLDLVMLENIHIHKTGALIRASVNMGALACPTSRGTRRRRWTTTPSASVWPFRSRMTCSTWRATPPSSASRAVPTRPTRRPPIHR
jgi:hypothetical protein